MSGKRRQRNPLRNLVHGLIASPWLWGGLLSVGFYAAVPHLPVYQELIERYFCGHWVEYATAGLFFVGVAVLLTKALRLPAEHAALKRNLLSGLNADPPRDPVAAAERIESELRQADRPDQQSRLAARLRDVCEYVRGRRSAEALDDHLGYLAELAGQRLHDSYALVRTVTWAVPILGFLGTVIGITMAIANVTPDQLESSLTEVTGGLAIAFDTTALSLTLSMLLVFGTFIIERGEQQVLDRIEDYGIRRLSTLFPTQTAVQGPLAEAESQAASELLKRTQSLIDWQTRLWQDSLESLRTRWSGTLEKQQACLDQALQSGFAASLADHSDQLAEVRSSFLQAFEAASRSLAQQMATFQTEMQTTREDNQQHAARLIQSLGQSVAAWQGQLKDSTAAMTGQLGELRQQGGILLRIVEQEEQLARLQDRLAQNLEAVRATDTFEETLQSLSAAVHLLTARSKKAA